MAPTDWGKFKFSEQLWSHIEEIAQWTRDNDVKLVFVIPPTIVEMQHRMSGFGLCGSQPPFSPPACGIGPGL